jgi:hypothetical protein
MLSLVNPWAGGALTSSANIGIDIATSNFPDLKNPWEVASMPGLRSLTAYRPGRRESLAGD